MQAPRFGSQRVVRALMATVLLAAPVAWPLHATADGERLLTGLGVAHYLYDTAWSDSQLVTVPGTRSPSGACVISASTTSGQAQREVALDPTTCAFQLEVASSSAMPNGGTPTSGAATSGLQGCIGVSTGSPLQSIQRDTMCWQTESVGTCAGCAFGGSSVRALRCPLAAVNTFVCQEGQPFDEEAGISDWIYWSSSSGCMTTAEYSATQEWALGWSLSATSWSSGQPSCTQLTMSQTSSMQAVDPDTLECVGSQVHLSDTFSANYSGPDSHTWGGWGDGPAVCSLEQAYVANSF